MGRSHCSCRCCILYTLSVIFLPHNPTPPTHPQDRECCSDHTPPRPRPKSREKKKKKKKESGKQQPATKTKLKHNADHQILLRAPLHCVALVFLSTSNFFQHSTNYSKQNEHTNKQRWGTRPPRTMKFHSPNLSNRRSTTSLLGGHDRTTTMVRSVVTVVYLFELLLLLLLFFVVCGCVGRPVPNDIQWHRDSGASFFSHTTYRKLHP